MEQIEASKLSGELYDLAFDQFSRQWIAKRLIEDLRTKETLKILDVGGRGGKTREFFEGDDVKVADLFDGDEPWYVKASGLDLPFADGSFDVVTCFDVLEHIPSGDRDKFVREMARVSNDLVLVAAPFDDPLVARAEREANEAWEALRNEPHPWLIEHIENDLPKQAELEKLFLDLGMSFTMYHSNNLILWSAVQRLIFLADYVQRPERIIAVNRFYNQHLFELGDAAPPSYRLVFVASKDLDRKKLRQESLQSFEPASCLGFAKEFLAAIEGLVVDETAAASLKSQLKQSRTDLKEKERQLQEFAQTLDNVYSSKAWRTISAIKHLLRVARIRQR